MPRSKQLDPATSAVLALIQEFRLCDEVAEKLFGCTAAQLALIAAIARLGKASVQTVAMELRLHQSSASAVALELDRKGLAVRNKSKTDKRFSELSLTRKGKGLAARVGRTGRPLLEAALSLLPETAIHDAARSINRLAEAMAEQRAMLLPAGHDDEI